MIRNCCFFSTMMPVITAIIALLVGPTTFAQGDGDEKKKPTLQFETIDGKTLTNENATGKVIVIEFWASWDKNSRDAVKQMKSINKKYGRQGVQVIGISLDEAQRHVDEAVRRWKLDWPQVLAQHHKGGKDKLIAEWGMKGTPDCFVIGANGELLWHGHPSDVDAQVKEALKSEEVEPGRWTSRVAAFEAFDAAREAMRTDKPLKELPDLFAAIPDDALTDPQVLKRASKLMGKLDSDDIVLPVLQNHKPSAELLDRLRKAVDEWEMEKAK